MNQEITKAQDVFIEKVNFICNKFGLNHVVAELYMILYFSNKPLSLDDMVARLKISKGSASVNIRALERYGAARRVWVKGSRKDYYEAEADIYKVILDRMRAIARGRLSETDDAISASYEVLKSISAAGTEEEESVKVFAERLQKLKELYDQAQAMFMLFNATLTNKESAGKALEQKVDLSYIGQTS